MELNSQYWKGRYEEGKTGWDVGYPSPVFVEYFKGVQNKNLDILIPGAGNAYEAEFLYQQGFAPKVLDWCKEPLMNLKSRVSSIPDSALLCEDFFKHQGQYDLIIEQTFFCALPPEMRGDYVSKMHTLLKPGGKLVGVLFGVELGPEGPPFGGSVSEYQNLFNKVFNSTTFEECRNSIPPRQGNELFFQAVK